MGSTEFLKRLDTSALASLLEAAQDAVLVTDERREVVYANPAACALLGQSEAELLGQDLLPLVAPPYREAVRQRLALSREGQDPPGFLEMAFARPDGGWRRVRCSAFRLEAGGSPYGAAVLRDTGEGQPHLRRLEALYQADAKLYSSLELQAVLQALVDVCVELLGADKSCIVAWDEARERLVTRAHRGFSGGWLEAMREYRGEGLLGEVARSGQAVIVQDTHADPRVARSLTDGEGIRSFMHLPLREGGEVFGVFNVDKLEPHGFDPEEQRVFHSLARRAASAIHNARVHAQAGGKAALEERQKLARELHDSVSQAIYGIVLGVRTAQTQLGRDPAQVPAALEFVMNLAEAAIAEMRSLIFELRPESLQQEGLVVALSKQVAAVRARHGLEVQPEFCDEPALSLEAKEALYRVAQEALHNTVKHARARRVRLRLRQEGAEVGLLVTDDGVGFDPARPHPGHLGLVSMRERLERLGGRLSLESAPGQGTRVEATLSV